MDNESNEWIEKTIVKKQIKYYERKNFNIIQEIGRGRFSKVFRANWRDRDRYFALKTFFSYNNVAMKELFHEVFIK